MANLVLDGTDGILLGSETFRGKYVIQTMNTVLAICKQAEKCFDQGEYYRSLMEYFGAYTANPNMSKVRCCRLAPEHCSCAYNQGTSSER